MHYIYSDDVNKLMNEDLRQMNQQQQLHKQSPVDVITENLSRAIRSQSPDYDSDISQFQQDDRISKRTLSLPSTPTMPNMESRRKQELMARLQFLSDLK